MPLEPSDISSIVAALQDSDWDQAVVQVGDVHIAVARNGARLAQGPAASAPEPRAAVQEAAPVAVPEPVTAPAAPAPAAVAPVPAAPAPAAASNGAASTDHVITAPSVGVFWRASEPGSAPFVSVGDAISTGDTVAIIEVMKLMSNLAASVTGVITAIHLENGESVEFGTPLFSVRIED